jgi:hypothetical protein
MASEPLLPVKKTHYISAVSLAMDSKKIFRSGMKSGIILYFGQNSQIVS